MILRNLAYSLLLILFVSSAWSEDYKVGPNDSLNIIVYDNPDLSDEFNVSASGAINFALIGELKVVGKTARQIESTIREKLISGKFIRDPQVRVSVGQFKSQSVAVLGEVTNPGKFVIEGDSSVLDMLAEAGGLTADAGEKVLLVKRGKRDRTLTTDIRGFNSGDFSKNHQVTAGDVLIVPKSESFYIYGEVRSPGVYKLERDMTVMQALSVGGGLTDRGTQKGMVVSRRDKSGRVSEFKVRLNDTLRHNDVVYVKESIF